MDHIENGQPLRIVTHQELMTPALKKKPLKFLGGCAPRLFIRKKEFFSLNIINKKELHSTWYGRQRKIRFFFIPCIGHAS